MTAHDSFTALFFVQWGGGTRGGVDSTPPPVGGDDEGGDESDSSRSEGVAAAAPTPGDPEPEPHRRAPSSSSSRPRLTACDRVILGYLRGRAGQDDMTDPVGVREIAAACEVSRKTVQVGLGRLAARGHVARLEAEVGSQEGHRYRVVAPERSEDVLRFGARRPGC